MTSEQYLKNNNNVIFKHFLTHILLYIINIFHKISISAYSLQVILILKKQLELVVKVNISRRSYTATTTVSYDRNL